MHCINNLVQAASFSARYLTGIAFEVDAYERRERVLASISDTPESLRWTLANDKL